MSNYNDDTDEETVYYTPSEDSADEELKVSEETLRKVPKDIVDLIINQPKPRLEEELEKLEEEKLELEDEFYHRNYGYLYATIPAPSWYGGEEYRSIMYPHYTTPDGNIELPHRPARREYAHRLEKHMEKIVGVKRSLYGSLYTDDNGQPNDYENDIEDYFDEHTWQPTDDKPLIFHRGRRAFKSKKYRGQRNPDV